MDALTREMLAREDRLAAATQRLPELAAAQRAAATEIDELARSALDAGATYAAVARAIGITRQGARKRWPGFSNY